MSNLRIYRRPITPVGSKGRREAEKEATCELVKDAFGQGTVLSHHEDGSPYLSQHPDTYISLSHCKDECVLVISDSPVGVDIETLRPQLAKVASKFLTPAELPLASDDLGTLARYWTAKEATFKCAAIPTLVISEIEVSPDMSIATARGKKFVLEITVADEKILTIATPASEL